MPARFAETALGYLYQTAGAAVLAGLPDDDLLRRFTAGGGESEAAFAALLRRHGPSVLRACRAIVDGPQDAEDAFQATFLVLAARARSLALRRPLGAWLYGVARRVALQARAEADRRRRYERRVARAEADGPDPSKPDVAGAVVDSVGRLPERFRAAVILCDLEGLSYAEAADRLGWTHATVRNRLARGRQRLRADLARKGLAPVACLAAGAVVPVPRALAAATARAAVRVAAGTADGLVPASVMTLMNGGLRAMWVSQLKGVGLSLLAAGALLAGAHGLTARAPTGQPEPARPTANAPAAAQAEGKTSIRGEMPPQILAPKGIVAKLTSTVTIEKPLDNVPLRDVIEFLSDKYELTFIVNTQAFNDHYGVVNVEDTLVRLPRMPGVMLQTVLRHLLDQLKGVALVRSHHIEVVTKEQAINEAYGRPAGRLMAILSESERLGQPLVNVVCEQRSLEEVLADIARQSGRNVILDPRVTGREKLAVTASLLNTPTDTAVRVLAELGNLKSVQLDNVFLVTTREIAAELQQEERARAEAKAREDARPGPPPTVPRGPAAKPPGQ